MARAAERQLDTMVDQALAVRARPGAYFIEQSHRPLFKEPRADSAEHIVRRLSFENDVVDSANVKQLSQQQSRRPRANDRYFCPQYLLPSLLQT
jgi:hypothetical protein